MAKIDDRVVASSRDQQIFERARFDRWQWKWWNGKYSRLPFRGDKPKRVRFLGQILPDYVSHGDRITIEIGRHSGTHLLDRMTIAHQVGRCGPDDDFSLRISMSREPDKVF